MFQPAGTLSELTHNSKWKYRSFKEWSRKNDIHIKLR